MKLYLAAGHYTGTQADARKLDRGFIHVEVPTDKEGLIAYLNGLAGEAPQSPPPAAPPPATDRSHHPLTFDDAWDGFPLARKLHFAALAMEEARDTLIPRKTT